MILIYIYLVEYANILYMLFHFYCLLKKLPYNVENLLKSDSLIGIKSKTNFVADSYEENVYMIAVFLSI